MKTCSGQLSKRFKKFGHYDEGDDENGKHMWRPNMRVENIQN